MYIGEVSKKIGLTKKAIMYYEEKDLVSPKKDENGYRIYEDKDIKRLKEIYLLRI